MTNCRRSKILMFFAAVSSLTNLAIGLFWRGRLRLPDGTTRFRPAISAASPCTRWPEQ
jgi:hypothetical protein